MTLEIKSVRIGWRSRLRVWLLRVFFKRLIGILGSRSEERLALLQVRCAAGLRGHYSGLPVHYRIVNGVPGPVLGELGESRPAGGPVLLYLHGGAFVFPAASGLQVELLGRLCRDLGAVGFMPDYRLVPANHHPAALNDCERAYRGLLELGIAAERIVVIGESAGGNLVLALLQRIRNAGLRPPACAVPISPITDLARMHAPPSRADNARHEALVPAAFAYRMLKWYVAGQDASDPQISPLYADYAGFPPLHFLASEREMLLDDSVLAASRARDAGVDVELSVWPVLPHAFLLFESTFAEAPQARHDIVAFIRRHVAAG